LALYNIGICYENGFGVDTNLIEAYKYYDLAVEQGNADIQYEVAVRYESLKYYDKAFKYYKLAANQGHAKAQYKLGKCYYDCQGVKQDYREAFKYFRDAKISYDRNDMKFLCRHNNACQHCGGTFEGKFFKKCSKCGKVKNYISFKHKK